jgi:hypothetical protein
MSLGDEACYFGVPRESVRESTSSEASVLVLVLSLSNVVEARQQSYTLHSFPNSVLLGMDFQQVITAACHGVSLHLIRIGVKGRQ